MDSGLVLKKDFEDAAVPRELRKTHDGGRSLKVMSLSKRGDLEKVPTMAPAQGAGLFVVARLGQPVHMVRTESLPLLSPSPLAYTLPWCEQAGFSR